MQTVPDQSLLQTEIKQPFQDEAVAVLRDLRRATASVLAACAGVERAVDVANRLGLDRALAWKGWQVAQGTGPCPSPAHIPGRAAFARFLEAAGGAGVGVEAVESARAAYTALQQLTARHAGDRAAAGTMLGALTDEGRTRLETAIRRDGFRASAHFLGVQAAALLQIDALLPAAGAEFRPDVIRVRGHLGLRRHRPGAPWVVARTTLVNSGGPSAQIARAPLMVPGPGAAGADGAPAGPGSFEGAPALLTPFCSAPTPRVERRVIDGVTVEDEWQPGEVGHTGAVDVVLGERMSQLSRRSAGVDALVMRVTTPAERLCYDVLAPEGVMVGSPLARVHSTVHAEFPFLRSPEFDAVPVPEAFTDMGPATSAAPAAEIPHHAEIMAWLLGRLGERPERWRLWRLRMKFPPVPICVAAVYRAGA